MKNNSAMKPGYMPQLDSLRAIALIFVVLTHWIPARQLATGEWVTQVNLFGAGNMALQLFFIMSGFLITGILLSARDKGELIGEGKTSVLRRFYARRFLRIFPIYYLTLIVLYLIGLPSIVDPMGWHLSYTNNFFYSLRGDWYGPGSHFWSLSVEEQFYFVWPLIVLFAPRRFLLPFFVFCILLAPAFRYYAQAHLGFNYVQLAVNPLRSLDTLGLGALFAYLQRQEKAKNNTIERTRRLAITIGISAVSVIACTVAFRNFGSEFVRNNIIFGAFPFALLMLLYLTAIGFKGWLGRFLELKPLLYIGKISYGVYIFHAFIPLLTGYLFAKFGSDPNLFFGMWGLIGFNFIVLIMIGSASWFLYENPLNHLKRFFPYVGAKPVAPGNMADGSALSLGAVAGCRLSGIEDSEPNKGRHSHPSADDPDARSKPLHPESTDG